MNRLTKKQKEALKKPCPNCGGQLHEVENQESRENNLWCHSCDLSMDGSGGYVV